MVQLVQLHVGYLLHYVDEYFSHSLSAEIQHPIHLARLILDYSTKPLSLRRVPPNLLAGPGATDFAESLQLPVLPPDCLVSDSARARWLKWARDLKVADSRADAEASEVSEASSIRTDLQTEDKLSRLPPYSSDEDQLHPLGREIAGSLHASPPVVGQPQSMYHSFLFRSRCTHAV